MKIYVPIYVSSRINKFVGEFNSEFEVDKQDKLISSYLKLWNYIYHRQLKSKNYPKFYVDIYSKTLQRKFNFKLNNKSISYKKLVRDLIQIGLIEVNQTYSNKLNFSKSYRVVKDIHWKEPVCLDFGLEKEPKNNYIIQYPEYKKLIEIIYRSNIDIEKVHNWLDINEGISIGYEKKSKYKQYKYLDDYQIFNSIYQTQNYFDGNFWFHVDECGRFYSNFTSLPSYCRNFVTLDGEELHEIDIRNCHPLLLNCLINHPQFKEDCESGVIYEKLSTQSGWDREWMKIQFLTLLNNPKTPKSGILSKTLDEVYPGLKMEISNIKPLHEKLTELEVNMFLKPLMNSSIDFLSCHDSVYVKKSNIEDVKNIIRYQFNKKGLNPKIRIK